MASIEECVELSNYYAPEHLIIASEKAENLLGQIQNAGSVFVGNYSQKVPVIMRVGQITPCRPMVMHGIIVVFHWIASFVRLFSNA